ATVWIPIHGVGIALAQVVRRQDIDGAYLVAQIRGMPGNAVQYSIGVSSGERIGPPLRRLECSGRVALRRARQLLKLNPQRRRARGHPSRVQHKLLPDNDRRTPRQDTRFSLRTSDGGVTRAVGKMDQRYLG